MWHYYCWSFVTLFSPASLNKWLFFIPYRWPLRYDQWWECKFIAEGIIDQGKFQACQNSVCTYATSENVSLSLRTTTASFWSLWLQKKPKQNLVRYVVMRRLRPLSPSTPVSCSQIQYLCSLANISDLESKVCHISVFKRNIISYNLVKRQYARCLKWHAMQKFYDCYDWSLSNAHLPSSFPWDNSGREIKGIASQGNGW